MSGVFSTINELVGLQIALINIMSDRGKGLLFGPKASFRNLT
jgi:hypothetical protein